MTKAIYVVNIGDANKALYEISIPSIKIYANKIGASFIEIKEKQFVKFPYSYEKFRIYKGGKNYDWNIYIDADYLIRDTLFDVTEVCPIDAVGHWGTFGADSWFEMDEIFKKDTETVIEEVLTVESERKFRIPYNELEKEMKPITRPRFIAFTDGFVVASKQCHEIWKPLDFTYDEALHLARRHHQIGQYTLARNLAANHYKSFTFQSEERKLGGQFDKSVLYHIEITSHENKYFNPECARQYLSGEMTDV